MWFRVEFHRDGSIKESRPVEARGTDSGLVVYVDADGIAAATRDAIAWRKRYLEQARKNQRNSRARMARIGICRSCLRRKTDPGKRECAKCRESNAERRKVKYVVLGAPGASPDAIEVVRAKIKESRGRHQYSVDTLAAALKGEPVNMDVANRVVSALKRDGHAASIQREGGPVKRGGRYSLNDCELDLLREVKAARGRLSSVKFGEWLDEEIQKREQRRATDPSVTEAA